MFIIRFLSFIKLRNSMVHCYRSSMFCYELCFQLMFCIRLYFIWSIFFIIALILLVPTLVLVQFYTCSATFWQLSIWIPLEFRLIITSLTFSLERYYSTFFCSISPNNFGDFLIFDNLRNNAYLLTLKYRAISATFSFYI